MTETESKRLAYADAERRGDDESFTSFLEHPMTKLSLGMIPQAEHPDVVRLVLRAAFDAGKSRGGSAVLMPLLESLGRDRGEKKSAS